MIMKGLRFGMLLQFAIGPMCLMVFNASITHGFLLALHLVLAITLVDATYIALSCVGVAAVINRARIKTMIKLVGCVVLILFGVNTISNVFELSLLPNIALFSTGSSQNLFVQGLLLTASNPLTIVFWSSMFSTQMIENKWDKTHLFLFGVGCVMATVIFLTIVAFLGITVTSFLPRAITQILNAIVGVVLIFLGIDLLFERGHRGRNRGAR